MLLEFISILRIYLKKKNLIIFFSASVFSVYFLIEMLTFSVNFPRIDDWSSVFAAIYYQQSNPVWLDAVFYTGNEHLVWFSRFLMMFILLINSYNVIHVNILDWGLLSASVILFWYLLKKTDSRLVWLVIPISALLFNPKIFFGSIIASFGLAWHLTLFFSICIIVLFSKERLSKKLFVIAMIISILSSFSTVLGVLTWFVGFIFLIKNIKQNKFYLIIWTTVVLIIALLFYILSSSEKGVLDISNVLTVNGVLYSLEYVVNPYTIAPDALKHILGFLILVVSSLLSIFFIFKKNTRSFPWIMCIVLGILFTVLTTVGRLDVRPPHQSYFIIMSTITEIGLLVLFSILFLERKTFKSKLLSKFITIIFFIFIILQVSMLGSTYVYYIDKIHDGDLEKTKEISYSCFDLPSNHDNTCRKFYISGDPSRVLQDWELSKSDTFTVINFFIANKLALFSNNDFFTHLETKRNSLINNVNNATQSTTIQGDVQMINEKLINKNDIIHVKENFVKLKGWIKNDSVKPKMILLVDNIPFMLADQNLINKSNVLTTNSGMEEVMFWTFSFFPAYLEDGCHMISIIGLSGDQIFNINEKFTLCYDSPKKYIPGNLYPNYFQDIIKKIINLFN